FMAQDEFTGANERFPATRWSVIAGVRSEDGAGAHASAGHALRGLLEARLQVRALALESRCPRRSGSYPGIFRRNAGARVESRGSGIEPTRGDISPTLAGRRAHPH